MAYSPGIHAGPFAVGMFADDTAADGGREFAGLVVGDLVREVTYARSATGSGTGTQRGYGGYNGTGGTRSYGNGGTGQLPGGFPGQGGQAGQGGQQAGTTGSRTNG